MVRGGAQRNSSDVNLLATSGCCMPAVSDDLEMHFLSPDRTETGEVYKCIVHGTAAATEAGWFMAGRTGFAPGVHRGVSEEMRAARWA